jgi:hypothetical protein
MIIHLFTFSQLFVRGGRLRVPWDCFKWEVIVVNNNILNAPRGNWEAGNKNGQLLATFHEVGSSLNVHQSFNFAQLFQGGEATRPN